MIGSTVSHYKILEKLGGGGMGVVYKAEDTKLHRTVALKFLPPAFSFDEEAKQRFVHEAQAASSLQHNNICNIHDIDEIEDGKIFICMDFYDGETLKKKIESGPLKIDDAIETTLQIASGLQKAHEKGIIHRDIKPANIFITNDGAVKILDFGLAKLSSQTVLTKMGSTVGTIAYMSPEQTKGEKVDQRTDIWSLGVVLYEMITGKLPFKGEYEQAIIYSILNEKPEPPTRKHAGVPIELERVINKALSKNPDERYQSVNDFTVELNSILVEFTKFSSHGIEKISRKSRWDRPRNSGRTSSRWKWIVAGGLLILFLLALAYLNFYKRSLRPNINAVTHLLQLPFREILYSGLSGDGNWVVFWAASNEDEYCSLYQMHSSGGESRRVISDTTWYQCGWQAEISQDGSQIACNVWEGDKFPLYIIPIIGTGIRKLPVDGAMGIRWRPDGGRIGYTLYNELWSIKPKGEDNRREFKDTLDLGGNFHFCYSPTGNSVAWIRHFAEGYEEIFIHNLVTHDEQQLTFAQKNIEDVTWTNQDQIVFASDIAGSLNLWMIPEKGGEPMQLTRGSGPDDHPRISNDGSRLLYQSMQFVGHVMIASTSGKEWQQVTFNDKSIYGSKGFSPDGKRIVVNMADPRFGWAGGNILRCYIMDRNGSNRREIKINDEESTYFQSWSPDGGRLAFWSYTIGKDSADICLIDLSGSVAPKKIFKYPSANYVMSRWLDSARIVVCIYPFKSYILNLTDGSSSPNSEDSTWTFPLPGRNVILLTDFRKGREGWWVIREEGKKQRKRLIAPLKGDLSQDLGWLIESEKPIGIGKIEIVSIPDGKRTILSIKTPERGWFGLHLGYGGKEVIINSYANKGQLSIMENPFTR